MPLAQRPDSGGANGGAALALVGNARLLISPLCGLQQPGRAPAISARRGPPSPDVGTQPGRAASRRQPTAGGLPHCLPELKQVRATSAPAKEAVPGTEDYARQLTQEIVAGEKK